MNTGAEQPGLCLGKTPAPGRQAGGKLSPGLQSVRLHSSGEECPGDGVMGGASMERLGIPGHGAAEVQTLKPTPLLCFFTDMAPKGHGLAVP